MLAETYNILVCIKVHFSSDFLGHLIIKEQNEFWGCFNA